MAKCIYFKIILFLFSVYTINGSNNIDSLLVIASCKTNLDSNTVNACTKLAHYYVKQRQLNDALIFSSKAKSISEKINYEKGYINSINALATIYTEKGEINKALKLYDSCVVYCTQKNNRKGLMYVYNNIALANYNIGNHKNAIVNFFNAIKIAEEDKKWENLAKYYNNLSRVYSDFEDYLNAIFYVKKSIEIENQINGNPENIIIRSINLSNYYNESGDFNEAVSVINKALELNKMHLNNDLWEAYLRNNLGHSYLKQEKYKLSFTQYEFANSFFVNNNDSVNASTTYTHLAYLSHLAKNEAKAYQYISNSYLYTLNYQLDFVSRKFRYYVSSLIYEKKAEYALALSYLKKHNELSDSVFAKEKTKAVMEMQTKYNSKLQTDSIKHKNNEISFQKSVNDRIQKLSSQKNYLIIALSFISIVLIGLSVYIIKINSKTKIFNQELVIQKKIIETKNSENENLLAEIHHRVKNNLQVISSLLSLQGKSIGDSSAKIAIEEGKQRVKSMELVHKMLYEKNNFSSINMHDYIYKLSMHLREVFAVSEEKFELKLHDIKVKLDIETAVPIALMINELMINSFKYAYPVTDKLLIEISLFEKQNELCLTFKDNGQCDDESKITNSSSFGVKLIQLLVKQLNGTMSIEIKNGLNYEFIFKEYKIIT